MSDALHVGDALPSPDAETTNAASPESTPDADGVATHATNDANENATENPTENAPTRARKFLTAHLAAYPIVIAWGVALTPIVLRRMSPSEVWESSQNEATTAVIARLLLPCLACFVVLHAAALPWIRASSADASARGKKIFVALYVLVASIAAFGGAASWLLLLYK